MKSLSRICILAVPVLSLLTVARAEIVAGWDVDGVELDEGYSAPYTLAAHTTATHIASASISLSSHVTNTLSADQYGFKIPTEASQTSLAGAISNGHYMAVELTAAEPYGINLGSLEINGYASSTGCDDVAVLSSVDGFSADAAIASATNVAGVTGGWDTDDSGFGAPINLSDPKYSKLKQVTFRFYGWNSTSVAGLTYIRQLSGLDLEFTGTVEEIVPPGLSLIVK